MIRHLFSHLTGTGRTSRPRRRAGTRRSKGIVISRRLLQKPLASWVEKPHAYCIRCFASLSVASRNCPFCLRLLLNCALYYQIVCWQPVYPLRDTKDERLVRVLWRWPSPTPHYPKAYRLITPAEFRETNRLSAAYVSESLCDTLILDPYTGIGMQLQLLAAVK